jgi:hypothetical protein
MLQHTWQLLQLLQLPLLHQQQQQQCPQVLVGSLLHQHQPAWQPTLMWHCAQEWLLMSNIWLPPATRHLKLAYMLQGLLQPRLQLQKQCLSSMQPAARAAADRQQQQLHPAAVTHLQCVTKAAVLGAAARVLCQQQEQEQQAYLASKQHSSQAPPTSVLAAAVKPLVTAGTTMQMQLQATSAQQHHC